MDGRAAERDDLRLTLGGNDHHIGSKSITSGFKAATNVVSNAYTYVSSGQAWNDVKAGASWLADKATQAWNVVADTTTRWAKDTFKKLKDGDGAFEFAFDEEPEGAD